MKSILPQRGVRHDSIEYLQMISSRKHFNVALRYVKEKGLDTHYLYWCLDHNSDPNPAAGGPSLTATNTSAIKLLQYKVREAEAYQGLNQH